MRCDAEVVAEQEDARCSSIYRTFQAWTRSAFLDPVESQTVQTALTLSSREFSGSLTTVMLPWRTSPAEGVGGGCQKSCFRSPTD